ncbi:MAG: hypothetical protein CME21_16520 [Gemmatimonadetes bacterium]|nr:hypothetical protein [Gemmatimonadota bacterium]HCK08759.1 hypothetical protein [Candidatus Latescibacterota bacterium]
MSPSLSPPAEGREQGAGSRKGREGLWAKAGHVRGTRTGTFTDIEEVHKCILFGVCDVKKSAWVFCFVKKISQSSCLRMIGSHPNQLIDANRLQESPIMSIQ